MNRTKSKKPKSHLDALVLGSGRGPIIRTGAGKHDSRPKRERTRNASFRAALRDQ